MWLKGSRRSKHLQVRRETERCYGLPVVLLVGFSCLQPAAVCPFDTLFWCLRIWHTLHCVHEHLNSMSGRNEHRDNIGMCTFFAKAAAEALLGTAISSVLCESLSWHDWGLLLHPVEQLAAWL